MDSFPCPGPLHFLSIQHDKYRHTVNADTFYGPLSIRINRVSRYIQEKFCLLFTIFPVSSIIQLDYHPICCITLVFFLFLLPVTVVPEDNAHVKFRGKNKVQCEGCGNNQLLLEVTCFILNPKTCLIEIISLKKEIVFREG